MVFSSFEFIFVFLPIAICGYYLFARKSICASNIWLLFASFCFYAWWSIRFLFLLVFSILFNYVAGRIIGCSTRFKKIFLVIGIIVNAGLLIFFKYTNFFIFSINRFFKTDWNFINIILPLGISFYTFQALSYVIDVYQGKTCAEKSVLNLALYISLFPQLIAGPIVDHKMMIPQFDSAENHKLNYKNLSFGFTLFSLALFKKVVIADKLSPLVAEIFTREADNLTIFEAWIGVIAYTFQLYFDFSAYSEMAIGLGKMFNLTFPSNFDSPYQATSIIDFWRRWHMTLGSWIKNYIYIPLGGNRKGQARKMLNLFIAMTVCGFWHGAGFHFIVWGMLHGVLLVINHSWRKLAKEHNFQIPKFICFILTFGFVCAGWAIFRADNLWQGLIICKKMINYRTFVLPAGGKIENMFVFLNYLGVKFVTLSDYPYSLLLELAAVVFCVPNAQKLTEKYFSANLKWLFIAFAALFYSLYVMAGNQNLQEFLYFQF